MATKTVKTETKKEEVKVTATKVEAAKKAETPVKAAEKAEAPKAAAEKKTAAKKTTTTAKKTTSTAAKKTTAAKAKEVVAKYILQYQHIEVEETELLRRFKEKWVQEMGRKESEIKDLIAYVKPEEYCAYFVVNNIDTVRVFL